jgi:prepilin signal peptidase PulO-like enzyme (type II secretory pathway)
VEAILLLGRLLLAGVFLVASLTKLADRAQFRQTLVDFGIPVFLASPISLLLPFVELAIGVALIPVATAPWGAIGALVLLAVFTIGIGVNLAQGKNPDCNCFGQLHAAPIGISTLMRNGLLAGLAGFIVLAGWNNPGPSVMEWMAGLTSFQVIGLVVGAIVLGIFAIGGGLLLNLWHQQGRLLLRLEALEEKLGVPAQSGEQAPSGLPVGTQAPAFSLVDLNGKTHTLKSLLELGKPLVLIFSDVNCGPCTALMPDIAHWQKEYPNTLTIVPISRGDRKSNQRKAKEFGVKTMLLQKDREVV